MENQYQNATSSYPSYDGALIWGITDLFIVIFTLAGNILTVCAIRLSKKLSAVMSNHFIFSLALSDIMVALFMPYHYAFYVMDELGSNKKTCILRFTLICLACSCSIYNLLAIAFDRYVAIVHPLHYTRYMTNRTVYTIIFIGWVVSVSLATVPIYWNEWQGGYKCEMNMVLPKNYINFILTPMFALIWVVMLLVYFRIWREASGHAKRLRDCRNYGNGAVPNDSKSVQVVLLILGCFSICWLPYFGVITYMRIGETTRSSLLYEIAFTLAMANSGMNPLIYAWKNTNYRKAFWCLLCCKNPNNFNSKSSFITNHVPSKKNSTVEGGVCNGRVEDVLYSERDIQMKDNMSSKDVDAECSGVTECTIVVNDMAQERQI